MYDEDWDTPPVGWWELQTYLRCARTVSSEQQAIATLCHIIGCKTDYVPLGKCSSKIYNKTLSPLSMPIVPLFGALYHWIVATSELENTAKNDQCVLRRCVDGLAADAAVANVGG